MSDRENPWLRRDFMRQLSAWPWTGSIASSLATATATAAAACPPPAAETGLEEIVDMNMSGPVEPNMVGAYGAWAASLVGEQPGRLSWRRSDFQDLGQWRTRAQERFRECLQQPEVGPLADIRVDEQGVFDGVEYERLSWQLPYGPRTSAVFLKPAGVTGRLPALLGLHDHGGNKYFGHAKIARTASDPHPLMTSHQEHYYGGVAWANAFAKRGFAVLVHDTFAFGSRRVQPADLPAVARPENVPLAAELTTSAEIQAYNAFAGQHEHLMAKSLFCAGTTWPGVFTVEDQRALDYLVSRSDVDADRVGCAGLSGGGLRTVYLTALDDRIRCACCVGMMTTWQDYLLHKAHTHTWMIYVPHLPRDLDYPELLGLRVPTPILVQNNREDSLFSLSAMEQADQILADVYRKAGASAAYRATFYPGPHKFDLAMQDEAAAWFQQWLKCA